MNNDELIQKRAKETPLGWKVNLMNMLSTSLMCLAEDIDRDLRSIKTEDGATMHFDREKKRQYRMLCDCLQTGAKQFHKSIADATAWYDKLNIEGQVWNILKGDDRLYDNYTCDAKELIQVMMLYVDRARTDEGFYSIFRHLRSLPEGNVFPESEIQHFKFKRPLVACEGATVETAYGKGVLSMQTNGNNWIINMDDGTQRVLKPTMFKIVV